MSINKCSRLKANDKIEHGGLSLTVEEWALRIGIGVYALYDRIEKWPIEKALLSKKHDSDFYKGRKGVKFMDYMGRSMSLTECAIEMGISISALSHRIKRKGLEKALLMGVTKRTGITKDPEYKSWYYSHHSRKEWSTYEEFIAEVGRSKIGDRLIRIDSSLPLGKGNAKWYTPAFEHINPTTSTMLTYSGETMTMREWAKKKGMKYETLYQRIGRLGWSVENALTIPTRNRAILQKV